MKRGKMMGFIAILIVIVVMIAGTFQNFAIANAVSNDDWVILEEEHISIKAPSEYASKYAEELKSELKLSDKIYVSYYDLTLEKPYDGAQIIIFYDPSIKESRALAGNPIRIGQGFWNEPNDLLIGHELGHIFTRKRGLIFSGGEGWAQFIRQYAFWEIGTEAFPSWTPPITWYPHLEDPYQWMKDIEQKELNEYKQNGCNFENITPNAWLEYYKK
jgi:hypothetical protein